MILLAMREGPSIVRIGLIAAVGLFCAAAAAASGATSPTMCSPGGVAGEIPPNESWDFFTNYGNYMPRVHCLRTSGGNPDWAWIAPLILLSGGVVAGYLVIYRFWRRCYLAEEVHDRNDPLMQLAYLFVLCAVCGYGFQVIMFFWPVYRMQAILLVLLNVVTWRFIWKLKPFELSFQAKRLQRQLNEQLTREKKMFEAKNHELLAARDELAVAVDELANMNRELDDFAYAASHDLKSPLRAIHNLAEFISEDIGDVAPKGTKQDIAMLQARVIRMEGMLDGLLQYSRVPRKKDAAEPCELSDVIDDAVQLLDIPAEIQVETGLIEVELVTPRAPLEQVIRNLVDNAVKHHDRTDGIVRIEVEDLGPFVEISVIDDGPGIEEKFQDRIFGMFQTLRRRDEVDSTGIGLALVKRIVCKQGGQIEVESQPGEGVAFRFTWPKNQAQLALDSSHREEVLSCG
ncbi:ATP-binding protein [Pirellulales bacterium]|nr:ATP-binding protein [Pirellulales bacterium]